MSVPRAFHALTLVVVLAASLMHTSRAQADGNCGKRTAKITATGHLRLNSTLDDCSDGQIEVLDERDPRRPTLYSNGHVEIPVEPTQGPRTLNIENLRDENLRDDSAWVAVWLLPSLRGADNVQLRDAAIVHEFDESTTLKLPERTSRQAGALIRVFKGIEFDTAAPEPTPRGCTNANGDRFTAIYQLSADLVLPLDSRDQFLAPIDYQHPEPLIRRKARDRSSYQLITINGIPVDKGPIYFRESRAEGNSLARILTRALLTFLSASLAPFAGDDTLSKCKDELEKLPKLTHRAVILRIAPMGDDTTNTVIACGEPGCPDEKKRYAKVVLSAPPPKASFGLLLGAGYSQFLHPVHEKYEYLPATPGGSGTGSLYRLTATDYAADEFMAFLSLGMKIRFDQASERKYFNHFFVGFTPLSVSGVKPRALTQVGATIGIELYRPFYFTTTAMFRQVDALVGTQTVNDAVFVGPGGTAPTPRTEKEWRHLVNFGIGVDLVPLGEDVIKAAGDAFKD